MGATDHLRSEVAQVQVGLAKFFGGVGEIYREFSVILGCSKEMIPIKRMSFNILQCCDFAIEFRRFFTKSMECFLKFEPPQDVYQ